jgi:lipoyl(octanoyl) transferase
MKMKNKKILVKDIGKLSFSDAWQYQEKIFKKIIDQKVQNRSLNEKIETNNFLILTNIIMYIQLERVEIYLTY